MKKLILKLICGILIVSLCAFCFAACTRDNKEKETTDNTDGRVDDSDGVINEDNGTDKTNNNGVVGDIVDGGESIAGDIIDGGETVLDDAKDMIDGKDTSRNSTDTSR